MNLPDKTEDDLSPSSPHRCCHLKQKTFLNQLLTRAFSLALWCTPSFAKKSFIFRLIYSVVLVFFIYLIVSVKFCTTTQLVLDAIAYNPVEHAQNLCNEGRLFAAYEYLSFYEKIPGVSPSQEFLALKEQIGNDRSTFSYMTKELCKGLFLGESEEEYGVTAEMVTEAVALGDARALYGEARHYVNGEEVNPVNVGLSTLGLALAAAQMGPQAAVVAPFRSIVNLLRKSSVLMSKPLRAGIRRIFLPVINNSEAVVNGLKKGEIHPELGEVIRQCRAAFDSVADLAQRSPRAALQVIRHTDDVNNLSRNARVVMQMGQDATQILVHGGKESLEAAAQLQKAGKLDGSTLKRAMKYGKPGLKALLDMTLEELEEQVRFQRILLSGKGLYYFKRLIAYIPMSAAFPLTVYLGLVFYKTWFVRSKREKTAMPAPDAAAS